MGQTCIWTRCLVLSSSLQSMKITLECDIVVKRAALIHTQIIWLGCDWELVLSICISVRVLNLFLLFCLRGIVFSHSYWHLIAKAILWGAWGDIKIPEWSDCQECAYWSSPPPFRMLLIILIRHPKGLVKPHWQLCWIQGCIANYFPVVWFLSADH